MAFFKNKVCYYLQISGGFTIFAHIVIEIEGTNPDMIANNQQPFEPVHPRPTIKDEIKFRNISQRQPAKEMGVSYSVLNEILNRKRAVTTQYALLPEAALNIDADI